LAEKYRTPVILLADETIAHLREQATVPRLEQIEIFDRKKPGPSDTAFFGSEEVAPMPSIGEGFNVAVTASTHDEYGVRFTQDPLVHRRMLSKLNGKISSHADDIVEVEDYNVDDCKVGIISYGCTSRAVYEAAERAEAEGTSTGYIRLKTVWPFPDKAIKRLDESAERIIVPEMNLGQISREVQRIACNAEVIPLNKIGGGELITPEELLAKILEGGKQSD
jgi:2-oxoglutarate ferredoxin oxidoreductase subunit alpha